MKIKTLLFILCALPGMAFSEAELDVYTSASQEQPAQVLSHIHDMRQMMAESALIRQSWAPGTLITTSAATQQAQQQYLNLQNQLKAWEATESGDTRQTISNVIRQLQGLRVTGRQFTSMDEDLILNNNTANRQLQGKYNVFTATRPGNVLLLGALSGAGKQPWVAGRTVREYLAEHQFLSGANLNEAMVIDPNGTVRVAPVAYWNYRHVEAEPGSVIWIGFSHWTLPRQYKNLNQNILSVLAHRIPE